MRGLMRLLFVLGVGFVASACYAGFGGTPGAISAGAGHTCAVMEDGTVDCWGDNGEDQLGDRSSFAARSNRGPVLEIDTAAEVVSGENHSCARLTDLTVECWGDNGSGQIGDGSWTDADNPQAVSGLSDVVDISAGPNHTCAVLLDGTARCWGQGQYGRLGDGGTADQNTPVVVQNLSNARSVAAGWDHSCAVLNDGTAQCWGRNNAGQIGDGTTNPAPSPQAVSGLVDATTITAGRAHTCVTRSGAAAQCWGANSDGRLGDGSTVDRLVPTDISGGIELAVMDAGRTSTCGIGTLGATSCWGDNTFGQLGDGSKTSSPVPVVVAGVEAAAQVSVGHSHACVVLDDSNGKCWGSNTLGQLGDGTTTDSTSPVGITGAVLHETATVGDTTVAVTSNFGCALGEDSKVRCWGTDTGSLSPTVVEGFSGPAVALQSRPYDTMCALIGSGAVECFDSSLTPSPTPITGALQFGVGVTHECAVVADTTVRCSGGNYHGQLGDGTTINHYADSVQAGSLTGALEVAAGGDHTCARLDDHTVWCWGENTSGQLGDGTNVDSPLPVQVTGLPTGVDVVDVAVGSSFSCAVLLDGTAWCWGGNTSGQLGDGTLAGRNTAGQVIGLPGSVSIELGPARACARSATRKAWCWGNGTSGALGNGSDANSSTPLLVDDNLIAEALSVNTSTTCAVLTGGQVQCWGANDDGEAGTGVVTPAEYSPVYVLE